MRETGNGDNPRRRRVMDRKVKWALVLLAVIFGSAIGIALTKRQGGTANVDVDPFLRVSHASGHDGQESERPMTDSCVENLREHVKTAKGKAVDLTKHFPVSPDAIWSYVDEIGNQHDVKVNELKKTQDVDAQRMEELHDMIQEGHKVMAINNQLYFLFGSNAVVTADGDSCQITGVYGAQKDGNYHPMVASQVNANIGVAQDSRKFVRPIGEPCFSPYFALYMSGTVYQSNPQSYVKKYLKHYGLVYLGQKNHRDWRVIAFRQPSTKRIYFVFRGVTSFSSAMQAAFGATRSTLRRWNSFVRKIMRKNNGYYVYATIGHSRGGWFANRVKVPYKVWRVTFNGHKCLSGKYNINLRCKHDVVSANSNQYTTLRCSGHSLTAFKGKLRYRSWRDWNRRVSKQIRRSRRCLYPTNPSRFLKKKKRRRRRRRRRSRRRRRRRRRGRRSRGRGRGF